MPGVLPSRSRARRSWIALLASLTCAAIPWPGSHAASAEPSRTAPRTVPPATPPTVVVGVDVSLTGRASVLGLQSRNAVRLWPQTLGGAPARYVVLDDASNVDRARANMQAFLAPASGPAVDAVVGFVTTPLAQAVLPDAARARTPLIVLAGAPSLVEPVDPTRAWVFKMSQNDGLMARALVDDMLRRGYRDVAFFGFDDAYGEGWRLAFTAAAAGRLRIVAQEQYPRNAQALVSQAQRIIAARPAAVLVAATGADAVLPQRTLRERGFGGQVYQTHGIATPDFLKEGGDAVEGTLFAAGPAMFAHALPARQPAKPAAVAFAHLYEGQYGADTVTQFSADAYGAWMLLDHAVGVVLRAGLQPGDEAFRVALRKALEDTRGLAVPNGILNLSPADHQGLGAEAAVIGSVRGGRYVYLPD